MVGGFAVFLLGLRDLLVVVRVADEIAPGSAGALLFSALLSVVLGVSLLWRGRGLLRLTPWSWWLTVLSLVVGLLFVSLALLGGGAPGGGLILAFLLLLFLLAYFLSVRRHFQRPSPP